MIFTGTFNTYDNNQTYNITIGNTGTTTTITDPTDDNLYQLAASDMVVMFDTDPVTITCDRDDLLKRIIISQATINLISNQDLTDYLFATTNRSIPVTITLNGSNVFFGYVDPLQFSQGYAHNYESISITATDPLGALENLKVDQLPNISKSTEITPYNLITTILAKANITGTITEYINAEVKRAMQNTKLQMKVFFGDDEDDYKSCFEILETVCKYFNLYIAMNDANTVILTSTINNTPSQNTISNFKNLASDESTSLSTDDAYSQVTLTCKIEPVEDLVVSFDDKDHIYSNYDDYVKYMTEYVSVGEHGRAWSGFYDLINGYPTDYDACYTKDHFVYTFRNDMWDFGSGANKNYIEYLGGSIDYSTGATTPMTGDQLSLLNWLARSPCRAALVGFGAADKIPGSGASKDNSVKSNITLDKYLVISTMGQYQNDTATLNSYSTVLQASQPICKYRGIDSNILSPSDNNVINFIVISGSIILNPLQRLTGPNWDSDTQTLTNYWLTCKNAFVWTSDNYFERGCMYHTVPHQESNEGAYYNQYWYSGTNGVYGFLDNSANKTFKYEYSAAGESLDKISKMPIICCQLKVGDKYCVERLDLGESGANNFEWMTSERANQLGISPTFTLGIDPKIDDFILGQKWQISNSIDYTMNLDKTGTAIPIKLSDQLSGPIEFSILGPYNATWKQITKYYHGWWFWEHTGWDEDTYSILGNCQSIMINNLKFEMTSNNGGINAAKTTADNDLVYASNMNPAYIETQEDNIDICTPLTLEECQQWGIKVQTSNSYVYNSDNTPFRGFNSGNDKVKPEVCYVDYMYKEYQSPARILETQLKSSAFSNGMYGFKMNNEMLTSYFSGLSIGDSRIMSYESSLKYKTLDVKFRQHKTISNEQI